MGTSKQHESAKQMELFDLFAERLPALERDSLPALVSLFELPVHWAEAAKDGGAYRCFRRLAVPWGRSGSGKSSMQGRNSI